MIRRNMLPALLEKLTQDLVEGQKARDSIRVATLRFLISGINNAKIAKGRDLNDQEVEQEISKEGKRHSESILAYETAGRDDLVSKEKRELEIIQSYLPEPLSESELENFVKEAIAALGASSIADLGKVIKSVMSSAGPKADGAKVSEITKRLLES
jgi:uncharacterized protein YqeY